MIYTAMRYLLLCMMPSLMASGQEALPKNSTWSDTAMYYIQELKAGALLVRLRSRSMAIEQLIREGRVQEAAAIRKRQYDLNREMVMAYRREFNFCKVYFFYGDSSPALTQGRRNGFLLNDSLQMDPDIRIAESFSLIADFGSPSMESKYDRTNQEAEKSQRGLVQEAIVIYDMNFRQLKYPFPYYAQESFPQSLVTSDWTLKVKSLNRKLESFYSRVRKVKTG